MKKTIATAMALLFLLGSICLFPSCRNNAEDAPDNGFLAEEDSEELENQDSIKSEILNIEKEYLDSDGYVDESMVDSVIQDVLDFIDGQKDLIDYYEKGNNSVYVRFFDGSAYIYQPKVKNIKAKGEGLRIISCQPSFTELGENDAPDKSAETLESTMIVMTSFSSEDNLDDDDVTVESILDLKGGGIIIWDGHGAYSETSHSTLLINTPYSQLRQSYKEDCLDGSLIDTNGGTLISGKFFEKHFEENDFKDAIIYLGACSSAEDDYLAGIFIQKGAKCVIGNTDVTTVDCDSAIMESFFKKYSFGFSVAESLSKAKEENENKLSEVKADIVSFGDESYSLKEMIENTEESSKRDKIVASSSQAKKDWKSSAVDMIYNYYTYNKGLPYNDRFFFYLIDVNNDNVPEIFEGASGGTARFMISEFYYWNGKEYRKGSFNIEDSVIYDITPYRNKNTSKIEFWESVLPDDLSVNDSKISLYKESKRISLNNGVITYDKILDRQEYINVLHFKSEYSDEEIDEAFEGLMEEKRDFDNQYEYAEDVKYSYKSFRAANFFNGGLNEESYHETVTSAEAKKIVENYINNSPDGHFDNIGIYR